MDVYVHVFLYVCMYVYKYTDLFIHTIPDQTRPDTTRPTCTKNHTSLSFCIQPAKPLLGTERLPTYLHIEVDVYYIHMSMCKYLINTVYSVYSTGRDRNP